MKFWIAILGIGIGTTAQATPLVLQNEQVVYDRVTNKIYIATTYDAANCAVPTLKLEYPGMQCTDRSEPTQAHAEVVQGNSKPCTKMTPRMKSIQLSIDIAKDLPPGCRGEDFNLILDGVSNSSPYLVSKAAAKGFCEAQRSNSVPASTTDVSDNRIDTSAK